MARVLLQPALLSETAEEFKQRTADEASKSPFAYRQPCAASLLTIRATPEIADPLTSDLEQTRARTGAECAVCYRHLGGVKQKIINPKSKIR
jgi:hypothetical protein